MIHVAGVAEAEFRTDIPKPLLELEKESGNNSSYSEGIEGVKTVLTANSKSTLEDK
jgi:hypothetical protein